MIYLIEKTVEISAAHQLTSLPKEHKCARPHGHNYVIKIVLGASSLDQHGMILDFDTIGNFIKQFDHHDLNDFFNPTTAEKFCQVLWDGIEKAILGPINQGTKPKNLVSLITVSVAETANNVATLSGGKI